MASIVTLLARSWVRTHTAATAAISKHFCYGLYDGDNLEAFQQEHGDVPVLLVIPAMSDVNGALPHPGVRVLQSVLRHEGIPCEVINYNLPCNHPQPVFDHLIRTIRALNVKVLGVSTYSQAIGGTLGLLRRVRETFPDLKVVLGGPHPTESYLGLMGVSFIDYICRGEAEESFPRLVKLLLAGESGGCSIPGIYRFNRDTNQIDGTVAPFVDVEKLDEHHLLRYRFSPDELKQQRLYRGCHGTTGAEYWPVALVRGCPYDCTFCAAYQMSGKKLRYRSVNSVVDDLEFYSQAYGRKHFSFIDDAFTQQYSYVIALCEEIVRRGLDVYWTTDNGIRYETLGSGMLLESFLRKTGLESVDELVRLMMRAGWRGTAVGIESGSARVRKDLVRKGGAHLTNAQILSNLKDLKQASQKEGVYFYINGFLMAGFPELPLPRGKVIAAETAEEMEQTRAFALELRDRGAIDMMNLSMVIPLPGTDMWDCLNIEEKLEVLLSCVPEHHPAAQTLGDIEKRILARYKDTLEATRYDEGPEASFWLEIYRLPDDVQMLVMQSYDSFNVDAAYKIKLKRLDPSYLWDYRESVLDDFYKGLSMKLRMLRHVVRRSSSLPDFAAYLTLMGRKYDTTEKQRVGATIHE